MVIGVTGGIAAGKSTFCKILNDIKPTSILLLTDKIAKEQQMIGEVSYQGIVDCFGKSILNEDKTINSKALGEIVFANKEKLEKLNQITHPNVINYVRDVINENRDKLIIIESALLFDCELKDLCDVTIFVTANEKHRVDRMKNIRNYSEEKIKNILDKQNLDIKKATIVIENSGTYEDLKEKGLFVIDKVLEKNGIF